MEFLDGSPLDELINQYKSTGLPTDDVLEIIKGITSALAYAHSEHIIHSDFKPGNVFVTKKGIAKAFDFGIARAVAQVEHMEESPQDQPVFDAGNLGALTPAYASLEMLEGDEVLEYVRAKPGKAVLIAVAVGFLVGYATRPRD